MRVRYCSSAVPVEASSLLWRARVEAAVVCGACGRVLQEERRAVDPGTAAALDAFLARLDACIAVEQPYTLILGARRRRARLHISTGSPAVVEEHAVPYV